ncbi:MAG: NAD(P)/FAD-dependent oxidoreductase [Actinomycetota bacterium]|nr:NAD(P)/FAD-dependent oxidoreductase [Actinomycetota bacterium]
MDAGYDVIVVGGGAAGPAGAIALARSRRSVLVIDDGDPRNAAAGHVHNFLTRDGAAPEELYAAGRAELEAYAGQVTRARVDTLRRDGDLFRVGADSKTVTARRLLIATGSRDELPDIPGLAARWGVDVLHCPYCHGWEVRDRRIGVLATGPMAVHQALLFRQLSPHVLLLQHTGPAPAPEELEQLAALKIPVVIGTVVAVEAGDDTGLTGVRLDDGTHTGLDALVVAPVCRARAGLLAPLGLQPGEVRAGQQLMGTQIDADATGATTAAGVWVAGNVASIQAQVVSSAAAGLAAAAAINADLINADAARALQAYRDQRTDVGNTWDQRYASIEQVWSGQPNTALVTEITGLPPGRALDVGCGEGADAIWLAANGWDVTALDVSQVALKRAARHARDAGAPVQWLHAALTDAALSAGTYDLVSAQYPALLRTPGRDAERKLLGAVAPGGVLLLVHHADMDTKQAIEQAQAAGINPADYVMPADIAALLDDTWQREVSEQRPRPPRSGAGSHHTHDIVLRARRLR